MSVSTAPESTIPEYFTATHVLTLMERARETRVNDLMDTLKDILVQDGIAATAECISLALYALEGELLNSTERQQFLAAQTAVITLLSARLPKELQHQMDLAICQTKHLVADLINTDSDADNETDRTAPGNLPVQPAAPVHPTKPMESKESTEPSDRVSPAIIVNGPEWISTTEAVRRFGLNAARWQRAVHDGWIQHRREPSRTHPGYRFLLWAPDAAGYAKMLQKGPQ